MCGHQTKFFACLSWLILWMGLNSSAIHAADIKSMTPDAQQQNNPVEEIRSLRSIVYGWVDAWEAKQFKTYMSYYSEGFRSGKTGYQQWRRKKNRLFKRSKTISLEISQLWIFIDSERAQASFVQKYTDDYLSDTGKKTLEFAGRDGTWKIVSEQWEPLAE